MESRCDTQRACLGEQSLSWRQRVSEDRDGTVITNWMHKSRNHSIDRRTNGPSGRRWQGRVENVFFCFFAQAGYENHFYACVFGRRTSSIHTAGTHYAYVFCFTVGIWNGSICMKISSWQSCWSITNGIIHITDCQPALLCSSSSPCQYFLFILYLHEQVRTDKYSHKEVRQ